MTTRRRTSSAWIALLLLILGTPSARGEEVAPPPGWDPARFLALVDVRPGMTGIGRTVLRGSDVVEFNVEILGVLQNVSPRGSMVLASLSGQNLETSGVVAGMSGSPIFIDGKLLGALAFGWAFSSEPIAGITPIEDMLRMEGKPAGFPQGPVSPRTGWPADRWEALLESHGAESLSRVGEALGASGTSNATGSLPLAMSGFSAGAADLLARWGAARGWIPMDAGVSAGSPGSGLASPADTLVPGSAVAVELARGDMNLAAIGTVTWRDGNRIWAFGHPMFNLGPSAYPLASADIVAVLPRLSSSFKMGGARTPLGAITRDYNSGVMGTLGPVPRLIPMNLSLTFAGETHDVRVEILDESQWTPALSGLFALSTMESFGRASGAATVRLRTRVDLADGRSISASAALAGFAPPAALAGEVARVVGLVAGNPFETVEIRNIEVEAVLEDEIEASFLERVSVAPGPRHPGDPLSLTLQLRDYRGRTSSRESIQRLPAELPPGTYRLVVCDATLSTQAEALRAPARYSPRSLQQLAMLLEDAPTLNSLVLRLVGEGSNPVVEGREMPRLPASLEVVLGSPFISGRTKGTGSTLWLERRLDFDGVVLGCEELNVTVVSPK